MTTNFGMRKCDLCGKVFRENFDERAFSQFCSMTVLCLDPIKGLERGLIVIILDKEYIKSFKEGDLVGGVVYYDQIVKLMNLEKMSFSNG